MDPTVEDIDQAAAHIDDTLTCLRRGVLIPVEAVHAVAGQVAAYTRDAGFTPEDLSLLTAYARLVIADMARLSPVTDHSLEEYFDEVLLHHQLQGELQARLGMLLDSLESRARRGDPHAIDDFIDLCAHGYRTHRALLSPARAPYNIVRVAHRARLPQALAAAVSPINAGRGRIAGHSNNPDAFRLAFDLLAHLAADPQSLTGPTARDALLDLAGYDETAGHAASRLPVHLLNDDEQRRLLQIHEARVDLYTSDPIQYPVPLATLRANRIVRGALWQASESRRLG